MDVPVNPEDELQKKTRRQKVFAVLPTLLTLGNAVCGFGAITVLARVGPSSSIEQANYFAEQMFMASQLIFLAMLFDALDGSAARLTNQTSDFGAQLDSLCDSISFGLAPAFMMLKLTHPDNNLIDSSMRAPFEFPARVLWPIAALFMVCALLRLARFNVETDEEDNHEGFSGLPSPAAAGVVASFPIGLIGLKELLSEGNLRWVKPVEEVLLPGVAMMLPLITLATAILMVSRVPYVHVFNQLVKGNRGRKQMLQLVFAMAIIFVRWEVAIPVLFCFFAFSAPLRVGWVRYFSRRRALRATET